MGVKVNRGKPLAGRAIGWGRERLCERMLSRAFIMIRTDIGGRQLFGFSLLRLTSAGCVLYEYTLVYPEKQPVPLIM